MNRNLITLLTAILLMTGAWGQNPVIQASIEQVRSDSISATLEHLQAYGTRYALVDNRKEIANWILSKFQLYGYSDVRLDSFKIDVNWVGIGDTTLWQYNVICSVNGASAPGEICILGGHYDSYCEGDPFTLAPGADDNGSAVAAILETARVMKLMNFQPESSVRFILFAAEEQGMLGGHYQAKKSSQQNEDIRLMFNIDMIANNPDSLNKVLLFNYKNAECAYNFATDAFQKYTNLSVFAGPSKDESRSDSYPFWMNGFPVTWAFEYDFNPNYHSEADVVSNCNMEYCAEITRGALATIMEMQFRPFPLDIMSNSSAENVTIRWKPTENKHLMGYNVFRSENDSAGFVQLNSTLVNDTFYADQPFETKKNFYYHVKLVNDSLKESTASNTVHGARFSFSDTLLVVACMKGMQTTPDSILQFYASILDSIPFHWYDMNKSNPLTLGTLSQYRNTLWVINSLEYDQITGEAAGDLGTFFENGGNMMFAGFSFSRFINGGIGFPYKHPESSVGSRYFKVDTVYKTINSYMYQAYPDQEGYDTLRVNPHKSMKPGYPGELYNIEVFTPAPGGKPICRFDSKYDPETTQGSQQDKIVGMEYIGNNFKTVLLSFSLYYIYAADARRFMNYVMKYKFGNLTNIPIITKDKFRISNYPNPVSQTTIFTYTLQEPGHVKLQVFDNFGNLVGEPFNSFQSKGKHEVLWNAGSLPVGIYFYQVMAGKEIRSGKMVKY